jgi:hypothetical protein
VEPDHIEEDELVVVSDPTSTVAGVIEFEVEVAYKVRPQRRKSYSAKRAFYSLLQAETMMNLGA